MPAFDKLEKAAFGPIQFPVKSVRFRSSYAHFIHVYLRVNGGVVEKLQRGLYICEMDAVFDTNIKGYGSLYPDSLKKLRQMYDRGDTMDLVIPTIGTMPAMITEWDQFADMTKVRSGESIKIPFLEENSQKFLQEAASKAQTDTIDNASENLKVTLEDFNLPPDERNIFDKIQDQANRILSYKDQADLYDGLMAARIESLTGYINEADQQLESLKHPENSALIQAMHALWEALVDFGANLANSPRGARIYVVPSLMSVSDIARAIYGNTSRASEIMLNNDLGDPYAVEAGTNIIYFVG
jgi:hypothetical protein